MQRGATGVWSSPPGKANLAVSLSVGGAVFALVFLGELPDKTMFATLLLASKGRPLAVWGGSVLAFAVHVAIAVALGAALFHLVPGRTLAVLIGGAFLAGSAYAFLTRDRSASTHTPPVLSERGALATSAVVVFVAEWGDLTQILMANLAARYHQPLTVALASFAALASVAGLAVAAGAGAPRLLSARTARLAAAVVLAGVGTYTVVQAAVG